MIHSEFCRAEFVLRINRNVQKQELMIFFPYNKPKIGGKMKIFQENRDEK